MYVVLLHADRVNVLVAPLQAQQSPAMFVELTFVHAAEQLPDVVVVSVFRP
jgi:hypothetical protein